MKIKRLLSKKTNAMSRQANRLDLVALVCCITFITPWWTRLTGWEPLHTHTVIKYLPTVNLNLASVFVLHGWRRHLDSLEAATEEYFQFKMEDGQANSRMGIGNVMVLPFDFAPRPIQSRPSIVPQSTNDLRVRVATAVSSVWHNQQYCSGARSSGTLQLSKTCECWVI